MNGNKALQRAISMYGSQAALGRELGVSRQVINSWLSRRVPANYAKKIEKLSYGWVKAKELREDVF